MERNKDEISNLLKKFEETNIVGATPGAYTTYSGSQDKIIDTCNILFQKASDMQNKVDTLYMKLNTKNTGVGTLRHEVETNIEEVFQGEGLRSDFRDGIAQSISEVVSYEIKNTDFGISKLQELEKNLCACADNNETLDKFGSHKHSANYEIRILTDEDIRTQLEYSHILDDVNNMYEAREQQIESKSRQLATLLNSFLSSSIEDIKVFTANNYNNVLELEEVYYSALNKNEVNFDITESGDCNIIIREEQYKNVWESPGSMTSSYDETFTIRKPAQYIQQKILQTIDKFFTECSVDGKKICYENESLQRYFIAVQSYLSIIPSGEELKNIIQSFVENGIYKAMDLESVVSTHIYITDYLDTIHKELMYVCDVLSNYSGKTIEAMVTNITDVLKDIELMIYVSNTSFGLE